MRRRDILLAASVAAALPLAAAPGFADTAAGSVVGLVGNCTVTRGGAAIALKHGKLKLRMSDGSVISVAAATRMTVSAYQTDAAGQRQNAQLNLGQGLLRAVVAPVTHPAAFEVSTAVGTAAVRSTDWFVEAKPGSTQVGVLSGTVVLNSAATGRAVTIPARWGARVEAGRDPVDARVWAPQEFQAVISRTDVP
jgi:hypothetical protein